MGRTIKENHYETLARDALPDIPLKRIAFIVNPAAGGKSGPGILHAIQPVLEDGGVSVRVWHTRYGGHARRIVLDEDLSEIDCVCVIGGDGTAHEAVNGLLGRPDGDEARRRLVIGLVPGGSGNTLAYDLKIPSPEVFVRQLLAGVVRAVDAVEIKGLSSPGTKRRATSYDDSPEDPYPDRCFSINMIGWGLPAQLLKTVNRLRWCGAAQYNIAAYLSLIRNVSYQGTITLVDDREREVRLTGDFVMVQAQTTVHMGEKLPFCPLARLDDGLVDLVLLGREGRMSLVKLMGKARAGQHIEDGKTSYYQCKSFTITPGPDERLSGERTVNVDGELVGGTPMTAKVLPGAVRFVTGW